MTDKLKPCPFCGSEKIGYSIKTTRRWERKYHVAMYCKDCNCYGARVLITPTEEYRSDVEKNEEYKKLAIEAWNTRKHIDGIIEKLEEMMQRHIAEAKCQEEYCNYYNRDHEIYAAGTYKYFIKQLKERIIE